MTDTKRKQPYKGFSNDVLCGNRTAMAMSLVFFFFFKYLSNQQLEGVFLKLGVKILCPTLQTTHMV